MKWLFSCCLLLLSFFYDLSYAWFSFLVHKQIKICKKQNREKYKLNFFWFLPSFCRLRIKFHLVFLNFQIYCRFMDFSLCFKTVGVWFCIFGFGICLRIWFFIGILLRFPTGIVRLEFPFFETHLYPQQQRQKKERQQTVLKVLITFFYSSGLSLNVIHFYYLFNFWNFCVYVEDVSG